jgi:hypothetical protein
VYLIAASAKSLNKVYLHSDSEHYSYCEYNADNPRDLGYGFPKTSPTEEELNRVRKLLEECA